MSLSDKRQTNIDPEFSSIIYLEEDVKEFIKQLKGDFEECRDETDIWADEERWNKFEKMFKKRIKGC